MSETDDRNDGAPDNDFQGTEQDHPLWKEFVAWAQEESISLDHHDDYDPWFRCFMAGAEAGERYAKNIL
jgi:hypothetical protein